MQSGSFGVGSDETVAAVAHPPAPRAAKTHRPAPARTAPAQKTAQPKPAAEQKPRKPKMSKFQLRQEMKKVSEGVRQVLAGGAAKIRATFEKFDENRDGECLGIAYKALNNKGTLHIRTVKQ